MKVTSPTPNTLTVATTIAAPSHYCYSEEARLVGRLPKFYRPRELPGCAIKMQILSLESRICMFNNLPVMMMLLV